MSASKALISRPSTEIVTSAARTVFNRLNGIINVYKPPGVSTNRVINMLTNNICKDLNEMYVPPSAPLVQIAKAGDEFAIDFVPNLAHNELVTGPAYMPGDFKWSVANPLGSVTSGVLVIGLKEGTRATYRLRQGALLHTFEVSGKFGKGTESNFSGSIMTMQATFDHVYPGPLSGLLTSMQASHQRKMFDMSGVDIQSQTAYELALKGPIRPAVKGIPVIYGIKLIEFIKPRFKIEVQGINIKEDYLGSLIAELGLQMRSAAFCQGIRCKNYGFFNYKDSLLRSHLRLQQIVDNMQTCGGIMKEHQRMFDDENSKPVGDLHVE